MDLFDVLTLLGGLSLFLFGMNLMGASLEKRAGSSLKILLGKLTSRKILGFLTGMGVTAVIQSSSATTVMVVGFVNSGLLTLRQAISVIMGANVGTTVTAWILSLTGLDGDNFFVMLLKPTSFTPILALIGVVLTMMAKSDKKKDVGMILLGFAGSLLLPKLADQLFLQFAQQMAELGIMDTTGRVDVLALFGNNVRATVFSIAYGFIPFIYLPALSIGINSLLLGLFAGVYVNNGISLLAYFAGIVPHGIFELPALILALSSGIYLCRKVTDYVRHNEKGVMGPLMKDLLRLFVMHIIPLLMAAAVIEAYVTPQLLKLFL